MLLLAAMAATFSCGAIMDGGECPAVSEGGRSIFFTIDLGEGLVQTRADDVWGNPYEDEIGNQFDNRIMPDQLHIAVYGTDNSYVGPVSDLVWWPADAQQTVYEFMGDISDLELNTQDTYKVAVFANSGAPSPTALNAATDGPEDMYFRIGDINPEADGSCIPMWGLVSTKFTLAERQELEDDIMLLRAAAKVRIKLHDDIVEEGYEIVGATLDRFNENGYTMPEGWAGYADTRLLYQEGCFRELSSAGTASLPFIVDAEGSEAVIYMPEFDADGTDDPMTLRLRDADGTEKDYKIQFRRYVDGAAGTEYYNVVRNHIYEYVVTQVKNGGTEVLLTCEVQPWEYVSEEVEFSSNVTVESGNEISWTEGYASLDNTAHQVVLRNNGTRAVCRFKISTPLGAEWFASIVMESGVYGAFAFDGASSGLVGEEAELKIYATSAAPQVVSTAKLRITVRTADGTTIVVKTLVNSDGDEYTLIQNI